MANDTPFSRSLWLWFAVCSVVCLGVLAVSPAKDFFREYRRYQDAYRGRLLAAAGSSKELKEAQAETVHVRQIWVPGLDNRIDRCTSCHLGVENPRMARAPQPFRLHPPTPHTPDDLQQFGCVTCHRGQGRATTRADAHGEAPDWDSPLLPLRYTEASCGTCHLADTVPEASLLSEGRKLLRSSGCLGCHHLEGSEKWQSHAPDLNGLAQKTYPQWVRAWLNAPRQLRPETSMPDFHLPTQEVEPLLAFLWVQPPLPGADIEAEEELPRGDLSRGEKLFRESRCISCHTVEGRGNGSASELAGIGSKVNRKWLGAFLANPHTFQPATPMPRYHFSREDLVDLTQYMLDEFIDPEAPARDAPYRPPQKLVEAGERLYRQYGCGGCHGVAGRKDVKTAPELTGIGGKPAALLDFGAREDLPRRLPDWLAAKVSQPRSFREGLRMPDFGFSAGQIQALVTALLSYGGGHMPEGYRVPEPKPNYVPPGRFGELVRTYRCLTCHEIQGIGGDISTAPLTAEGSKVKKEWLKQYLLLPTTIRPILIERMTPLWLPEEEAAFLADFMENVYVNDDITGEIFPARPPQEQTERGSRLFYERFGCQACHQVGGAGGYYGPPLDQSPAKLKSGWIAWWLRGPQRWRRDVRCPDYGLDETDARDVTAFLVSLPTAAQASQGVGAGP